MCVAHQAQSVVENSSDAFAEKLLSTLNQGALCLMVSVGHRTGLFDAMAELPPSTSEEIAVAAGMNERYVREWLGAMVTGEVVRIDPVSGKFELPSSHAACLTRKNPSDNMAVFAQYIPGLGYVEDEIVDCFQNGGGVSYDKFPRFHAVMEEDSGQSVVSSLSDHILPLDPTLTQKLSEGIQMLDLGCGRGRALHTLAETFPNSSFLGYDLSKDAIAYASSAAERSGLTNLSFEVRDLSDFHETADPDAFDLVTTFDAVHDQAYPLHLLKGIRRTLKSDGLYLMVDIHSSSDLAKNVDHPLGTLLYTVSCLHCMTVSLAQGGEGLGAMWGREKAEELLAAADFGSVEVHRLEHDVQNDYYLVRR
jgi:SAM-dependent methyltransferase